MDILNKIIGCDKSGVISTSIEPYLKKQHGEIANLFDKVNDYNLREITLNTFDLKCTQKSLLILGGIIIVFWLAIIYNKQSNIPNTYIAKIDKWYIVWIMCFIGFNYVLNENTASSVILSSIITLVYYKYLAVQQSASRSKIVTGPVERMTNMSNEEPNKESDASVKANMLISEGEKLLISAKAIKDQLVQNNTTENNQKLNEVSEMEKTGSKLIVLGEILKNKTIIQQAKQMICSGKQQIKQGTEKITVGQEMITKGLTEQGKTIIEEANALINNGNQLVDLGKRIKQESSDKLKQIEEIAMLTLDDIEPHIVNTNLEESPVESPVESQEDSQIEDSQIEEPIVVDSELSSDIAPVAMVTADGSIQDGHISPSIIQGATQSNIDAEIKEDQELKKKVLVLKAQDELNRAQIVEEHANDLIKNGDIVNGNKLIQEADIIKNNGVTLIECAQLIDKLGQLYGINNVSGNKITYGNSTIHGFSNEGHMAGF